MTPDHPSPNYQPSGKHLVPLVRGLSLIKERRKGIVDGFYTIGIVFLTFEALAVMVPAFFSIRDLHQDYLMALALRYGDNPYQSVENLWRRYMENRAYSGGLSHPSPHPPVAILLLLPFSFLPPALVSILWFLCSLAAVVTAINLGITTEQGWGEKKRISLALFAISIAGRHELLMGQLTCFILLLVTLSWRLLLRGDQVRAGLALGACLALKLFGLPILCVLAAKRYWRVVAGAVTGFCIIQSAVVTIVGVEPSVTYFENVLPTAYRVYRGRVANHSIFNFLYKSRYPFTYKLGPEGQILGIGQSNRVAVDSAKDFPVPPLTPSEATQDESLASLSRIVGILILIALVIKAASHNIGIGFHQAIILSCIGSPLAWSHSLVPVFLPIMIALWRDSNRANTPWLWCYVITLLSLVAAFVIPFDLIAGDLLYYATEKSGELHLVPLWARSLYLVTTTLLLLASMQPLTPASPPCNGFPPASTYAGPGLSTRGVQC